MQCTTNWDTQRRPARCRSAHRQSGDASSRCFGRQARRARGPSPRPAVMRERSAATRQPRPTRLKKKKQRLRRLCRQPQPHLCTVALAANVNLVDDAQVAVHRAVQQHLVEVALLAHYAAGVDRRLRRCADGRFARHVVDLGLSRQQNDAIDDVGREARSRQPEAGRGRARGGSAGRLSSKRKQRVIQRSKAQASGARQQRVVSAVIRLGGNEVAEVMRLATAAHCCAAVPLLAARHGCSGLQCTFGMTTRHTLSSLS